MGPKRQAVPVTKRALAQRINRWFRKDHPNQQLRSPRGRRQVNLNLGDYYLIDTRRNWVSRTHVDLEKLGRELEVLQPWERLE